MKTKGIIYDCDGVLFDSQSANLAYYGAILGQFGRPAIDPLDKETIHLCHTAASPQVLKNLLGEDLVEEALAVAADIDYRRFLPHLRSEPGIEQTLSLLSRRFVLGVATNRGQSVAGLLDHFGIADFFTTVVTSGDVARPKPYPDMLLVAAERLECVAGELIFIGDSSLDCEAARKAGVRFVGYKGEWRKHDMIGAHLELLKLLDLN